ncbi:hypothetical protein GGI13_006649 [Coemansia sp. RSA 455]|nr:hypothetical protein GGI13_006649 [Coemansia sp. RSA 455]
MPIPAPYPTIRTRTAPIAELSSVVAYNAPPRLPKTSSSDSPRPITAQLTKKKSYASLHSSALLQGRASVSKSSSSSASHERTLELLRTVLTAAQALGSELEPSQAAEVVAESIEPATRVLWSLTLDEQRIAFIETLHQLQHPHAEVIGSLNSLLCNRVAIGLLCPTSAADYSCALQRAACNNSAAVPIDIVGLTRSAAACSLSSSFDSDESVTTLGADDVERFDLGDAVDQAEQTVQGLKLGLVEMWASGGFWRGVSTRSWSSGSSHRGSSVHSTHTAVAEEPRPAVAEAKPAAITDHLGTCWPLDEASKDVASGWGRFYAELGGVRVPTRFRVPLHSLAMLATEQLMMRNDKIVCPLKNRLQEANPRRQRFEDYINATGTIPLQVPPTKLRRSPLRDSVVFCP